MALTHFSLVLALSMASALAAEPTVIRDAVFAPEFERALRHEPILLRDGGAKVVELGGARYFVAVGVTSVQGDSPAERIRQLRAGRVLALKAATEFVTGTFVTSEEKLSTTTTIITRDGVTTGSRQKVLDETTLARIRGVIQAPPVVGSWKSAEAQLFFYAIGTKLK